MPQEHLEIGVVVARRRLKGPWQSHQWLPRAVLPAVPAAAIGTRLGGAAEEETYYAGACTLLLHSGEVSHYRDNLASGRPSLWVALQAAGDDGHEIAAVTADPYEGEALAGSMGLTVEAVSMPAEIRDRIRAFVDAFWVEPTFVKRKRDRLEPETLGRRNSAAPRREGEP